MFLSQSISSTVSFFHSGLVKYTTTFCGNSFQILIIPVISNYNVVCVFECLRVRVQKEEKIGETLVLFSSMKLQNLKKKITVKKKNQRKVRDKKETFIKKIIS